jgi:hypothetical protein
MVICWLFFNTWAQNIMVFTALNSENHIMHINKYLALGSVAIFLLTACEKNNGQPAVTSTANIRFVFTFDSTQQRLNNLGQPTGLAAGNAAQSPRFNGMSAHYLELAPTATTLLGSGAVLYRAPEVTTGGANAIDFSKAVITGNNGVFVTVPIKNMAPGSYQWLRLSLAYQHYNVYLRAFGQTFDATVASFIGFNTYITNHKVKDSTLTVNGNRAQGYWAFETSSGPIGVVRSGQAPPGATTVPNPLFATSPVPAGSCVVTGQFATPLVVTGNETADITIVVSLSTNKSFEWQDVDGNGTYDPLNGDVVVDMGLRGMVPVRR